MTPSPSTALTRLLSGTALALALSLAAPALAQGGPGHGQGPGPMMGAGPHQRVIVVTGTGEARAQPDMAVFTTGTVTEAATAAEALAANSTAMEKLMAGITEAGIPAGDLQTAQFNIQPRYSQPVEGSNEAPRIVGYRVSNELRVTVRDLTKLGSLLDASVKLGANEAGSLSFGSTDPSGALAIARTQAVQDARMRAELYAKAADLRVGEVIRITDTADAGLMPVMRMEMMAASPVPIAPGEQVISASVTVTFAIQ